MKKTERKVWTKVSSTLLAAACTLALAGPAMAEGGYAGISFGQASGDIEFALFSGISNEICGQIADTTCNKDDSDTGFKIFAGSQFNKNFAIEFGYVDFGEFVVSGTDSVLGTTMYTFESDTLFASINGIIPLGQSFNLFGKLGAHLWNVDASLASSVIGSASGSDDGVDFLFGFGASFDVGKTISIRAEFEKFANVGDETTNGKADVDMFSAGLAFKF